MNKLPKKVGLLNRAVLWHLQTCMKLADKVGYHVVAAHLAAAIDALQEEALSDGELSDMEMDREERVDMVLEMFSKYGTIGKPGEDSTDAD